MANIFNDLKEFFAGKASEGFSNTAGFSDIELLMDNVYFSGDNDPDQKNSVAGNWYQQKPYAFKFTNRSNQTATFYLPIAPSNLNITTHFATNVISTMYGTVEEHSEQRYYDIVIQGTTGMSPRYYNLVETMAGDYRDVKAVGRAPFPVKDRVSGPLGGFLKRTQSLIESTLNQANDLLGDDNSSTGVDLRRTGYAAFHNFYKFLLVYKKDVAGEFGTNLSRKRHPLRFINYKDNNQYDVAIQTFQLTRDASDPMLYNYNIVMRAYNLRQADTQDIEGDISDRSIELGLDGVKTSTFAAIANKARQAKNAAYSAIAAAKGFGQ